MIDVSTKMTATVLLYVPEYIQPKIQVGLTLHRNVTLLLEVSQRTINKLFG